MLSHMRDHYCGLLTEADAGKVVHLSGWVQRTRDLGGVVFVWLRDRDGSGAAGIRRHRLLPGDLQPRPLAAQRVRASTALGEVRLRDEAAINRRPQDRPPSRCSCRTAVLLNKAETPPIYIDDDQPGRERDWCA